MQSLQRATAISDRMVDQSAKLKRVKKNVGSLESEKNKAKLALDATNQLKADVVVAEQA